MKRLYLILLLAAVALSGMAQNVGEAIYVFRNDGHHDGFLRSEVISIDFSNEDEDGNVYDEVVTQVITTPDSVYKIPLAVIDSISFVQPETVYQDDVVPLTGDLYQYVIGADGQKLKFKANTPSSLLPKVGDKVALLEQTDVLPNGFAGRVQSVSSQADAIIVDCEPIGIIEVAKQYYAVCIVDATTNENIDHSRAMPIQRTPIDKKFFLWPIGGYFDYSLSMLSGVSFTPRDDLLVSAGATISFLVDPYMRIKGVVMHDEDISGYVNLIAITDWEYTWNCHFSGGFEIDKNLSFLAEGIDIPIIPTINFFFDVGAYSNLNGELCFKARGEDEYRLIMQTIIDLQDLTNCRVKPNLLKLKSKPEITTLTGSIVAKVGLYVQLGVSFISSKLCKGGVEFDLGVKGEVELTSKVSDWEIAGTSTEFYERLKDNSYSLGFFGEAKLFGDFASGVANASSGFEFDLGPKLFTGGFVPIFKELTARWYNPSTSTGAQAGCRLERALFIPVRLGFAAYDSNNKYVNTVYDEGELYISSLQNSYYVSFDNLDPSQNYTLYPVVKLFGFDILASPSVELKNEQTVTTLSATNITDYSATLSGKLGFYIQSMQGQPFFLYGTNSNPRNNGYMIYADYQNGEDFSLNLTNLRPQTTYYFVAAYSNGSETIYGEVKSFKTSSEPTVVTGDAINVTMTGATLCGHYDCNETDIEYGIIYGKTGYDLNYYGDTKVAASTAANGDFSVELTDLEEKTKYLYLAYLRYDEKIVFGDVLSFTTGQENTGSDFLVVTNTERTSRTYADFDVTYKFTITMAGDKDKLSLASEYGFYIFNGNDYKFYPVTLNSEGSAEREVTFSINYSNFTKDFTRFYAIADDYNIGAYLQDASGLTILNEQKFEQLDYDVRPILKFENVSISSVEFINEYYSQKQRTDIVGGEYCNCKRREYRVTYSYDLILDGLFWVEKFLLYGERNNSHTYVDSDNDWWNAWTSDWIPIHRNGKYKFTDAHLNISTTWFPETEPEPKIFVDMNLLIELVDGYKDPNTIGWASNSHFNITVASGVGSANTYGSDGGIHGYLYDPFYH